MVGSWPTCGCITLLRCSHTRQRIPEEVKTKAKPPEGQIEHQMRVRCSSHRSGRPGETLTCPRESQALPLAARWHEQWQQRETAGKGGASSCQREVRMSSK